MDQIIELLQSINDRLLNIEALLAYQAEYDDNGIQPSDLDDMTEGYVNVESLG